MKIALLAAAAMVSLTDTAQAPEPAQIRTVLQQTRTLSPDRPGCVPILRQIGGPDRRVPGTRLDQQPAGEIILAVDRRMNGCHEATLLRDEQRRARR